MSFLGVSRSTNFLLYALWLFGLMFTQDSLPVQFLYRYMVLCRDTTMSVPVYILLMGIAASTTTASSIVSYLSDSRSDSDTKLAEQLFFNNQSEPRIAYFAPAVFIQH